MTKKRPKMDLTMFNFFCFCQLQAIRVIYLGYKLQHYVVSETTQIYKTMISLDSHISFASTNNPECTELNMQ